jgi:adenylyl- and sulfurtransferase ThiI
MSNIFQVLNNLKTVLVNTQQILVKQNMVQLNLILKIQENIKTVFKMIGIRLTKWFENDISIMQTQIVAELDQKLG